MKYLVIWYQDYDVTNIYAIISEDKLEDYIKYFQKLYEDQEEKAGRKVNIDGIIRHWYDHMNEGSINYMESNYSKTDCRIGFSYSVMEINSFEKTQL